MRPAAAYGCSFTTVKGGANVRCPLTNGRVAGVTTLFKDVGTWSHVAATFNGKEAILYVNGVAAAAASTSGRRRRRTSSTGSEAAGSLQEMSKPAATERRAFSVAIFARNGGDVLLIKHRRLGTWLPVGGEIEGDETPLESARRELAEETGLRGEFPARGSSGGVDGTPPGLIGYEEHTAGAKGLHMNFAFVADVPSRDLAACDEYSEARWVRDTASLSCPENVKQLVRLALAAPAAEAASTSTAAPTAPTATAASLSPAVPLFAPDLYLQALRFAAIAHAGQKVPGTDLPYLMHVASVAMEVTGALGAEPRDAASSALAVQCALLHDVVEDTSISIERVRAEFGPAVADGVLALSKDPALPKEQAMVDSLERIRAQPEAVWLVKLGDRITNLQPPPAHWTPERCRKYRLEAEKILAALGGASPFLAARMRAKIAAYARHEHPPAVESV